MMSDPTDCLMAAPTPASSAGSVQSALDKVASITDPGSDILMLLEKIPAVKSAIDRIEQTIAGDWDATLTAASAASALAQYNEALANAVKDSLGQMLSTWSGNAADAAGEYFNSFGNQIFSNADTMKNVSRELSAVGEGMEAIAEEIDSLLAAIIDKALAMLAELAAGVLLTVFTAGASDALAGMAEAADVYELCEDADRLLDCVDKAEKVVDDFEKFEKTIREMKAAIKDFREATGLADIEKMGKALEIGQGIAGGAGTIGLIGQSRGNAISEPTPYQDKAVAQ